jgi:hypothetical protein
VHLVHNLIHKYPKQPKIAPTEPKNNQKGLILPISEPILRTSAPKQPKRKPNVDFSELK